MILYKITPWKEKDDCNISPFTRYREAQEVAEVIYPEGYDIEEIDTDDLED